MKFVSKNLAETSKIASDFIASLKPAKRACVVGLFGELGAGKTTFTRSAAEVLGVEETVNSPTFVIERIFSVPNGAFKRFIHIDAYRLVHGQDLINLGWNEIVQDPENLIFIEWPEKVLDILPEDRIEVQFEHLNEKSRQITIQD
ncbi:MAG: tRNA (adenosine(37)-N6)-threonylcarbamoyltransferase complex ATPase subunit type 1 TsaE [bacterium]